MHRTRPSAALAAVLTALVVGLAACTGGDASRSSSRVGTEPAADAASQSPAPNAEGTAPDTAETPAPSPSPSSTTSSTGVLPALASGQSQDLLTDDRQARRAVGRKFETQDTGTTTALYAGDRTIKPSRCLNLDAMLDWGAPAEPTIGSTTWTSIAAKTGRGYVFQAITPSDKAASAVDYFRTQAADPCRTFTVARPATLIINNGPSKDIDVTTVGRPRTFDASGTPIHAYPVTLKYRTSADMTYGRTATTLKVWYLTSAPGNNLVTTLTSGLTGGEALELHRSTVERVADAATQQAATSGMAEPSTFEPAGRDSASAGGSSADDPTWPIDEIARETRAQWQGSKPSLRQVRNMVLLVCRQMQDVEFSDPNHSTMMQNLQGRIVAKWDLDRITGPFNAWNLIGTADARCKGATVITQMN